MNTPGPVLPAANVVHYCCKEGTPWYWAPIFLGLPGRLPGPFTKEAAERLESDIRDAEEAWEKICYETARNLP